MKTLLFALLFLILTGCGGDSQDTVLTDDKVSNETLEETTDTSSALTMEQKQVLAYMWHEEKLAHDIYLALNELNPSTQLYNISSRSESTHIELVETLVKTYDINITNSVDYGIAYSEEELRAMPEGVFALTQIQELYDTLYAMGTPSLVASLEVGCIVEVTDVDDLDEAIVIAGDKDDLVETFTILRAGSYNHYWAFDAGLKDIGISDGCCSLGDKFCKTEADYPRP